MDGQPMFPCPFVDPPPDWPKPNTTTPQPQQAPPLRTTNGRNDAAAPSSKRPNSMPERARLAKAPQPEAAVKCPRCDSTNTKFCYYNNYSLSQPRHFCKTCRRYWTRGGSLRNVPVGGGCRRSKRSSKSNRPQPPARPSTAVRYSAGLTTTSAIIPPPSLGSMSQYHLPFLGSLHHPDNLGLTFSSIPLLGIQRAEAVDQFPLASGGGVGVSSSTLEQWRSAQLQQQQFPFQLEDGALGPPPPLYQMDVGGTGADSTAAFNILGQTSSTATTGATSAASTAKMEEGMSQQQRQLQYMAAMHLGENVCGASATSTGADGNGHGSAAGWATADFTPAGFHSSSAGRGGLLY